MVTAEFKIECHIGIDPGDQSVGIGPGWDEETMVSTTTDTPDGTWINGVSFEPDDKLPVEDWPVTQVWTAFRAAGQSAFVSLVDVEEPKAWRRGLTGPVRQQMRDLPAPMLAAVQAEWERFKAVERERDEAEAAYYAEMAAEAERDREFEEG